MLILGLLLGAAMLVGFGGEAEWAPVAVGEELEGWTLTDVESHSEFRRFQFEQDGRVTTVEVVRRATSGGYSAQPAPGTRPPATLLEAVSELLDSAPDSMLMPQNPRFNRGIDENADPLEATRAAPLAALHCLPDDEVGELLSAGIAHDWSRVPAASWRISAILGGTSLIIGLLGFWRRRSRWLGGPLGEAPVPPVDRRDHLAAAGLACVSLAFFLPFVLGAAGQPPWGGPDTEIYGSLFWNASQGRGLYNAYEAMDHSGSHSSLGLYLLVPLYSLAPGPKVILWLNTALLVGCVAPIYLTARAALNRPYSAAIAILFLGFPALDGLLSSFHAVKAATPALCWAIYFLSRKRSVPFVIAICVAALFKENVSIVLIGLGAYLGFEKETRWAAAFVVCLGLTTYVVGTRVVIPAHFGDFGGGTLGHYSQFGGGLGAVATSPLTNPGVLFRQLTDKASLVYLAATLLPLVLLPALAPRHALIALPVLAQNVLSSSVYMRSSTNHYDSLLLPGLFFAAAFGLSKLPAGKVRLVVLLLAFGATATLDTAVGAPDPWRWEREEPSVVNELNELIEVVPDGASLAAPNSIASWLYRRSLLTRNGAGDGPRREAEYLIVSEDGHQHEDHLDQISGGGGYILLRDTRSFSDRCRSMMSADPTRR